MCIPAVSHSHRRSSIRLKYVENETPSGMAGVGMSSSATNEDYLDQLSRVLPWHRSFTSYERLFIVILVSTFVSMVGCILLCILCAQSPLRRRHYRQKRLGNDRSNLKEMDLTVVLPV